MNATLTEAPDTLGALWSGLLELRESVKRGDTGDARDRREARLDDACFSADAFVGVSVVDAGSLSEDQVAFATTYLAPCFAPLWARELGRAVTFGHVAQTIDGKIATSSGDSKWIGGIGNQTHAHRMRALCDAVLIGSRTLSTDAPKLNVRHVAGPDPVRIVVGRDVDVRALRDSAPAPVIVVGSAAPRQNDVDVLHVRRDGTGRFPMRAVLEALYARGITSVYVEGGACTIEHFLDEGVLDVLQIHIAPLIVGDGRAAFPRPSVERLVDAQRLHGAKFVRVDDGIMLVARCNGDAELSRGDDAKRVATALWHDRAGHSSLRSTPLRRPAAGWCEIETCFSAVSPGTEQLISSGRVPDELNAAMRCAYMEGQFPFPVKYGYSLVGRVVDGPPDVLGLAAHVFHPHQDRAVVRVPDLHLVPANVPMERATLAPNLETALNAVWDSQVGIGQRALVVGFGTVGSLIARLLSRVTGVDVAVLESDPAKRTLARQIGFAVIDGDPEPDSYDVAFHASASSDGLQAAVDAVGFEGRVIDASWYGTRSVTLALGGSFHLQRKSIESSQVGSVATGMRAQWSHARRMALVMRLLGDDIYDSHITRTIEFTDLPTLFAESASGLAPSLSILVRY